MFKTPGVLIVCCHMSLINYSVYGRTIIPRRSRACILFPDMFLEGSQKRAAQDRDPAPTNVNNCCSFQAPDPYHKVFLRLKKSRA